ncbi:MAG TPA: UPF0147 family protein [archaeon]|nr:UPF0147 family protein [archaeon]
MQMIHMDIETINRLLDEINDDRTVPRNIRTLITDAKNSLNSKQDIAVRINSVISTLDEVANDSNIPTYTRTQIWNVVSMLEVMNEQAKEKA